MTDSTTSTSVAELMPARPRKIAYVTYAVVAALVAAMLAGFAAIGTGAPPWLVFASAAVATLGSGLGLVAAGNVTKTAAATSVTAADDVPVEYIPADATEVTLDALEPVPAPAPAPAPAPDDDTVEVSGDEPSPTTNA